jgi:hypothetical protein
MVALHVCENPWLVQEHEKLTVDLTRFWKYKV